MADSIREALTGAFDKAEKEAPDTTISNVDADDSAPDTSSVADEASAPISDEAESTAEGASGGESIPDKAVSAPAAVAPAEPESPAPASWSAAERTEWAKVPKSAREAISRREGEMNRALQVSADARRRVSSLDEMARPYAPLLNSYGITVEQAMPGLLATRAALEVGTPEQKAQLVANLCADFGLDLELLDGALGHRYQGGRPEPRYAPQPPPNYRNDPALAPLYQIAEELQGRRLEAAKAQVAAVEGKPHYAAVRETMADLHDRAVAAGQTPNLERVYDLACQLHGLAEAPAAPLTGAAAVSAAAATLARARNAASSVTGAPAPSLGRKPGTGSARDEIEALMASRR